MNTSDAATEPGRSATTIAELTRSEMVNLSPAERRVARSLLADYPSAGLHTIAGLAERAQVSAPTVLRFAQRLGLEGFTALQEQLRAELTSHPAGPLSRIAQLPATGTPAQVIQNAVEELTATIRSSIATIPSYELNHTVELLADTARNVYVTGGPFSRTAAQYLGQHLQPIRPGVIVLDDPWRRNLSTILDITRRDIVLVIDIRRYHPETINLAAHAKERGASVVLITDQWLSPAAQHADVVLPTNVVSPSPVESLATALVLTELLFIPLAARLGDDARERLRNWDDLSKTAQPHLGTVR